MKRNNLKIVALGLSGILALGGCAVNAQGGAEQGRFQGTLEARSIDINAKVPGKIAEMLAEEGQSLKAGDPIALIDAKDLSAKKEGLSAQAQAALAGVQAAEAQLRAAQGQLQMAEASLQKAQNGVRSQEIIKAQAGYDITKKGYDRISALFNAGAASQAQLDEVETKLNIARQDLDMAKEGARKEDINAAQAQVAAANGAVAAAGSNVVVAQEKYLQCMAGVQEVDTYLTDAAIKAPIDGIVTMINTDQGELVSTGMSLATLTDLSDIWVELEIDELQLPQFKEGQSVTVTVPAYEGKVFAGKVMRLNPNPDYAVKKASNENGEFDLVCYGIKVRILESDVVLRPGMTAFVELEKAEIGQ